MSIWMPTLLESGSPLDHAEADARLRSAFRARFPGRSVDDVLCDRREALRFHALVRRRLRAPRLPGEAINARLLTLRKASRRGGLRADGGLTRPGGGSWAGDLGRNGVTDVEWADEMLADLFYARFRGHTVDQAICMTEYLGPFCREYRRLVGAPSLSDYQICKRLLRLRKRSSLPLLN